MAKNPTGQTSPNCGVGDVKVLYSSADLRDEIIRVLESPGPEDRRVVMVAFVGGQAEVFLPNPERMEIVCWLQPGATDAVTLGRLQKRGARLFESDRLHMKVYWSSRNGCVICSANASGAALGGGTQKEAGVWLPPGAVDIDRMWTEAKPKPVKASALKRLRRLSDEVIRNGVGHAPAATPDFAEWWRLPGRREWKLGAWEGTAEFANEAIEVAEKVFGIDAPHDYIDCEEGGVNRNDWVLSFNLSEIPGMGWLHADRVFAVPPTDKKAYLKDYPFQAVQFHPPNTYRPPFKIDTRFVRCFAQAAVDYGIKNLAESWTPPPKLLKRVAELYVSKAH